MSARVSAGYWQSTSLILPNETTLLLKFNRYDSATVVNKYNIL
jgi:hypothetical protein